MKVQSSKLKVKNFNLKLKIFLFTILFLIFNIGNANAQELSVSIDPPIFQINAEAPADVTAPLSVSNLSDQTITYSIFLMPFRSSGAEESEVEFDRSLLPEYEDIFKRVRIIDEGIPVTSVILSPRENKNLTLRITLPEGEKPKDYYFSVLFVTGGTENDLAGSASLARGGIGTNVLLSVGPKSETKGSIRQFLGPKIVTKGPVEFILSIFNESAHYITIDGHVVIKNMFGHKVGVIDLVPANILSLSERMIESENNKNTLPRVVFDEGFLLGFYTADLTVSLSEDGPILTRTLTFFAFPIQAMLILGAGSIVIIFMVSRVRRKRDQIS
ncbi:MAG: hypothetical protein A3A51_04735 [Candidatus Levybacteria bacterium RIFCSPLOWO2_01_FULL_39_10]|nr:MAG: hypothetical protein A3A51_04735 [Candidatus Levybacteria bacterium RIFCSPLOWO2_01_FULL_39_10]